MNKLRLSILIMLTIMLSTIPIISAQEYAIPNWVKGIAEFWSEGKINDKDFGEALTFLIDNKIIRINSDLQLDDATLQDMIHDLEKANKVLKIKNTRLQEKSTDLENADVTQDSELYLDDYFTEKITSQGNNIDELKSMINKLQDKNKKLENKITLLQNENNLLEINVTDVQHKNLKLESENKHLREQLEEKPNPAKQPIPEPTPEPEPLRTEPITHHHDMVRGDETPDFHILSGDSVWWHNEDNTNHYLVNTGNWEHYSYNCHGAPDCETVTDYLSSGLEGQVMNARVWEGDDTGFWFNPDMYPPGEYTYKCTYHVGEVGTIFVR